MVFLTTGHGRVRMNPNLYNSGKRGVPPLPVAVAIRPSEGCEPPNDGSSRLRAQLWLSGGVS